MSTVKKVREACISASIPQSLPVIEAYEMEVSKSGPTCMSITYAFICQGDPEHINPMQHFRQAMVFLGLQGNTCSLSRGPIARSNALGNSTLKSSIPSIIIRGFRNLSSITRNI
ncbi:hypothetical protein BOTNAR_0359g00100 [Botryotinia narcissicola]|uniref:Uncharacterized protein n=1 Tax=Botryotinia narcissicola TaxID=278944 RepID=A0A4Z1HY55_9HELO|nr:hypothetical protein BOTNAR_0359g00100 [Botryotinia narcissicola]